MFVKYIDLYLDKLQAHVHSLFPKINDLPRPPSSFCSRVYDVVRTISTLQLYTVYILTLVILQPQHSVLTK